MTSARPHVERFASSALADPGKPAALHYRDVQNAGYAVCGKPLVPEPSKRDSILPTCARCEKKAPCRCGAPRQGNCKHCGVAVCNSRDCRVLEHGLAVKQVRRNFRAAELVVPDNPVVCIPCHEERK